MVPSIPKVEKKARRFAPRQRAYGLRPSSWGGRPCLGLRPKRVQTKPHRKRTLLQFRI